VQQFKDHLQFIGHVNEVNKHFLLVLFIQIVSWVSEGFVHILDDNQWPYRIYMCAYCVYYCTLLGMAAETEFQVRHILFLVFCYKPKNNDLEFPNDYR